MTAGVCLTLSGCSWFAKDPCIGPDADLSNPVCVTQNQGNYRDTDNERWYCLGDLEAKDWSCATSQQETSRKLITADNWLADAGKFDLDAPRLSQFLTSRADSSQVGPSDRPKQASSVTDDSPAMQRQLVESGSSVEPTRSSLESEIVLATPGNYPTGITLAEIYTADAKRHGNPSPLLETLAPDAGISQTVQLTGVGNSRKARQQGMARPTSIVSSSASSTAQFSKPNQTVATSNQRDFNNFKESPSSGDPSFNYFMDLPPNDFAVQLKADRTLVGIQTFAREVSLDSPFVLKTIPSKSPIYILVLETFNDIQLASDAKKKWISQVDNDIEPWIGTVGSIQKTLHPIGALD